VGQHGQTERGRHFGPFELRLYTRFHPGYNLGMPNLPIIEKQDSISEYLRQAQTDLDRSRTYVDVIKLNRVADALQSVVYAQAEMLQLIKLVTNDR